MAKKYPKLVVEVWRSDKENVEHHYFMGEQRTYVFGINPKFISRAKIRHILKTLGLPSKI